MDNYGNILYVLIGLGWFLLKAYKKSQSKKQETREGMEPSSRQPNQKQETGKTFEELIMDQFGEKEESLQPEPVSTYRNEDKFLHSVLTHSHLAEDYQMSKTEMDSHRVQRQVRKVEIEELEQESLMAQVVPNGFDLRQAVVLNAILERPYK